MSAKTTLLIVDDQRLFAEGLRYVIESRAKDLEVLDTAENGQDALAKLREHEPDVILLDVRMPVMDGVEATRIIHQRYPKIKILILTTFDDDEYVRYSMENGAVGYLLKNRPPEELIDSIRALTRGILQIDPAVSAKLFHAGDPHRPDSEELFGRMRTLTVRERDVLKLLVEAARVAQIAGKLGIAEQTVRNHTASIYSKLGIHDRVDIFQLTSQIKFFLALDAPVGY